MKPARPAFTKLLVIFSTIVISSSFSFSEQKDFKHWPADASPSVVGNRLAERFVTTVDMSKIYPYVYPAICAWYGALRFAAAEHDTKLQQELIARFDQQYTPQIVALVHDPHVDHSMIGSVPLQIYLETRQDRYLHTGLEIADTQWAKPTPDGLTSETRFWIDPDR